MSTDWPQVYPTRDTTARKLYRVTFTSGTNKAEFTLYASAEGNAAIQASTLLAKPEFWSCTKIERV